MKGFLRKLGRAALSMTPLGPALAPAIGLVNEFLPADKRLDAGAATGRQVAAAYSSLPADRQAELDRRAEVELAEIAADVDVFEAMTAIEDRHSNTRPKIAMCMAFTVCIEGFMFMVAWFIAIVTGDTGTLAEIKSSWPMILALLTAQLAPVLKYFGDRSRDKRARLAAATGQEVGSAGLLSGIGQMLGRR